MQLNKLRGVGIAVLGALATLKISAYAVFHAMRGDLTSAMCDAQLDWWSQTLLRLARVELRVTGLEHVSRYPLESFVIVSNHLSFADIVVLFAVFRGRCIRMVTKSELFHVPVWGRALRVARFIEVDRANPERARASLRAAARDVRYRGVDIMVFPEGTRSRTGNLGSFKMGAFHLACDMRRYVIPVAITGTGALFSPDGAFVKRNVSVTVRIGEALNSDIYREPEALRAVTRFTIETMLKQE
jgi:1-acyl-sn-glycerol-3-phosphate acyltransferase